MSSSSNLANRPTFTTVTRVQDSAKVLVNLALVTIIAPQAQGTRLEFQGNAHIDVVEPVMSFLEGLKP